MAEKQEIHDALAEGPSSAKLAPKPARSVAQFRVGGMTCGACVESIESMLRQQEGIFSVSVALLAEKAVVEYDATRWTDAKIADEIEDIGFEADIQTETREDEQIFKVYGMTCASCTSSVEAGVLALDGVTSCAVSLATEEARIGFDPTKLGVRDIVEAIEDLGFDAVLNDETNRTQLESLSRAKEVSEWWHSFLVSLSFAVPVFIISMLMPKWHKTRSILMWQPIANLYLGDVLCLSLTTPVQFGVGRRFYSTSFKAIKHHTATMDVLIMLGTTASFVFSSLAMLASLFCSTDCSKPATFFETSTMLITFVSFGRYLENAAKGRTSEALSKLINLTPSTAIIYVDGEGMSQERKVPSELIQKGDYVKVIPGERIAADGVVVRGESTVDESMVTGEVLGVNKAPGSNVIGGTVNALGSFDFIVTRAGKETSLSQIVRLVSDAQTSKAPIQALADRVAGIFVPSVVLLGAVTFVFWMCVSHTMTGPLLPDVFHQTGSTKLMVCLKLCISVVVVACPCALGLSTPTAVMVGTGVGAQNGILIKGGGPLEASNTIGCVMFDKTGTLTKGRLSVSGLCWHDGEIQLGEDEHNEEEVTSIEEDKTHERRTKALNRNSVSGLTRIDVLTLVAAAEHKSEHPLARAIALYIDTYVGRSQQVDVSHFEIVPGGGLNCSAIINGVTHKVVVGSAAFVVANTSAVDPCVARYAEQHSLQGHSTVYAAVDGSVACVVSLADQLKPEARQCVDGLRRMGIRCGLITGDSRATALAIAHELAIDETDVYAEMSPNGKRSIIVKMREQLALSSPKKNGVAMVGDGINDSPALAAATLGIAVGGGTEIAMEAASIVLMRASLLDVAASLHLSRRIFRQIKLNYVWATVYNILFIPLAMGVGLPWGLHLHPMMAGAAMAFSSVSVVLSSLTLKWWRRPDWLRSADGDMDVDAGLGLGLGAEDSGRVSLAAAARDTAAHPFAFIVAPFHGPAVRLLDAIFGVAAPHRRPKQGHASDYESVPMDVV